MANLKLDNGPGAALHGSCISAYKRVCNEFGRFWAASNYLLEVNIAAIDKVHPIMDAHNTFANALQPEYKNPHQYFTAHLFIGLVASFELYLQDVVVAVVTAYPKKVGRTEFELSEILDASDYSELIRRAINDQLNKLMYKKPSEYLGEICSLLSIDKAALDPYWPRFVEAKARRDIGIHNGWRCNAVYIQKVKDAGLNSSYSQNESAFPNDEEYLRAVSDALEKIAKVLIEETLNKYALF